MFDNFFGSDTSRLVSARCPECAKAAQMGADCCLFCVHCAHEGVSHQVAPPTYSLGALAVLGPLGIVDGYAQTGGDALFLPGADLDGFPVPVMRACSVSGCPGVAVEHRSLCARCDRRRAKSRRGHIARHLANVAAIGALIAFLTGAGCDVLVHLALIAPFALVWLVASFVGQSAKSNKPGKPTRGARRHGR